MQTKLHFAKPSGAACTLIEMLVVIGICCLLTTFMLPALAHVHLNNSSAVCLSNLRRMQLGSNMYRDDNNDYLMPNAPVGDGPGWMAPSAESWSAAFANTNVAVYATARMWPYINQDISVFRCPADCIPSDNGYRIRSYSMNGQMGLPTNDYTAAYNPGWKIYQKGSDLTCPTPANAWVFCNESMYSLNDGWLQLSSASPSFPDVPAAYHAGGCGFSFADGHSEIHRWQGTHLTSAPYAYGVYNNGAFTPSSLTDPDWIWFNQHGTCKP